MSNDEKLKSTLEKAFPDTPEIFHRALQSALQGEPAPKRGPRRRGMLRLALCCALLLAVCTVSLAVANHYGVLNFDAGWDERYYFTLPEAQGMIRYDLCQVQVGDTLWRVKESVYDGRVLRVLYSVRDLNADAPYAADQDPWAAYSALTSREGVALACDGNGEIFVNGHGVNLEAVNMRLGAENGEIEGWLDCRMSYYDPATGTWPSIQATGDMLVEMPFVFSRERGAQEADRLAFTLQAGDAATAYALALPESTTLQTGAVFTFTDLHFSPANVFVTYQVYVPARNLPAVMPKDHESAEYWDMLLQLPEMRMLMSDRLVNEKGEQLGVSRDGWVRPILQPDGSLKIARHFESAPSTLYTPTIYLMLGDEKIAIPMRYQAK